MKHIVIPPHTEVFLNGKPHAFMHEQAGLFIEGEQVAPGFYGPPTTITGRDLGDEDLRSCVACESAPIPNEPNKVEQSSTSEMLAGFGELDINHEVRQMKELTDAIADLSSNFKELAINEANKRIDLHDALHGLKNQVRQFETRLAGLERVCRKQEERISLMQNYFATAKDCDPSGRSVPELLGMAYVGQSPPNPEHT